MFSELELTYSSQAAQAELALCTVLVLGRTQFLQQQGEGVAMAQRLFCTTSYYYWDGRKGVPFMEKGFLLFE